MMFVCSEARSDSTLMITSSSNLDQCNGYYTTCHFFEKILSIPMWMLYVMKLMFLMLGPANVDRTTVTRVAVGGWLLDKQEQVRSAPISERIDFRKVITDNGVEVSLQGSMNQEASIANGFSAGIVQCLSTGMLKSSQILYT